MRQSNYIVTIIIFFITCNDKSPQKRKALRESIEKKSLEEEDFNQRVIANNETQIETTE